MGKGAERLTPKQELYVQARARGLSQRAAYREAYPRSVNWKDSTVDSKACVLEADGKILARLRTLQNKSAEKAVITRSKLLSRLDGLADAAWEQVERCQASGAPIDRDASATLVKATSTLLPYALVDDGPADTVPPSDFGLLIAPPFLALHRAVHGSEGVDAWLPGGRSSGKSSAVSLEIVDGVMHHKDRSALVLMKNGVDIKDSAWEQIVWAIGSLGCSDDFDLVPSRRRIVRRSTGQAIVFRGCDKPDKTKSIKAPEGTYFAFLWFEEVDLFHGAAEVRTVTQSATRGPDGSPFFRFHTFNPPRSRDSWANRETRRREDAGMLVIRSTYLDMPHEWIPEQVREDASQLEADDPVAYKHEWLGEETGIGGEVFDRVVFREVTDDEIAAFERPMCGQDFGWWPDPWAATLSEWQPGARTLVSWREDGGNKLTPPKSAERLKALLTWDEDGEQVEHRVTVSSDDAAPEQIAAQRAEGIDARAAGKGNMRLASYRWLASINWVIDPVRCPRLAEEVRNKLHVRTRDGEWLEDIEDGDDHYIDATRYAVMPVVHRWRTAYRDQRGKG